VAIVHPGLDGVILPKVESAAGLATADWLLAQLEREQGLMPRAIDLVPIIETARGLNQIDAILAAGTRVKHIAFGAGDFTLDVNMAWCRDEAELAYARANIVTASRAAGIETPFDTVWADLRDADGFTHSAERAASLGFQGKMCIHPDQIAVTNAAFSPTEQQLSWAKRVVAANGAAPPRGTADIKKGVIEAVSWYSARSTPQSLEAIGGAVSAYLAKRAQIADSEVAGFGQLSPTHLLEAQQAEIPHKKAKASGPDQTPPRGD